MNRSMITQTLETLNISLDEIADEQSAEAFRILFQLIEELSEENEKLKTEIQKLQDENNLLKGEQAKPDIKPSMKKPNEDYSSEEERKHNEKQGIRWWLRLLITFDQNHNEITKYKRAQLWRYFKQIYSSEIY